MHRSDPTFLWLLAEGAVDGFATALGGTRLLTAEERASLDRRLTPGARRRYLGGRLLCRYALSARTGRPLDHWRFTRGAHGRPEPAPAGGAGPGPRFNLSHSDGLLACVVTRGRGCGVDVGPTPAPAALTAHPDRWLAPGERAELDRTAPGARAALAGELWVLKEAYLKALGTGLTGGPDRIAFVRRPGGRIAVRDPARPGAEARWRFDVIRPGPRHVLAVATEAGRPGPLRRTDLSDLSHLSDPYHLSGLSGLPLPGPSGRPIPYDTALARPGHRLLRT
ncbi:4'-phosphopantetheinyl transferase family protein [Streptomyces paludis]|uniref:4-phosphopantetheinyl transferase n=1 Tax=Streptomyces paludis TaxID=2282738 RepID=A0A345HY67_9ACTN|nr:4'-phosphopantetheinyl transferase superfamily protein [Streptomyces paludis]AXG81641.1 4-phosphopantetheinyl transferase [Streptomyces paludis]